MVYEKNFTSGVSVVKFHAKNTILSVGFDNGDVKLHKIYIRESADVAKNLVDEISLIKPHKKPIIGVELDFNIGYVFSISSEGQLVISEFNYQTNIKTLNVSKSCLTALLYDEFANLLILADNLGSLYFYNVSNPINPVKLQAIHSQFKAVSLIKLFSQSKRLFIGTKTGELHIFEIDLTKDGLHMKQENSIYGDSQLRVVNVYPSKDYLIVGYSNGSIYVYSEGNDYPECKHYFNLQKINI